MPVTRTCEVCGGSYRTKPNERLRFCSAACYHKWKKGKPVSEGSRLALLESNRRRKGEYRERASLICPNCGKHFVRARTYFGRSSEFCTRTCQYEWADRRAQALHESGQPLLSIGEEAVTCNICGRTMEQVGRHFAAIHGMDVRHRMTHTERSHLYNLTQGERLISHRLRERLREIAIARDSGSQFDGHRTPETHLAATEAMRTLAPLRREVRKSQKQEEVIERFAQGALRATYEKHVRACRTSTCPQCGKEWTHPASTKRTFCSVACSQAAASARCLEAAHRWMADPDRKTAWRKKLSDAKGGKKKLPCVICGTVFVHKYPKQQTCSAACKSVLMSRNMKEIRAKKKWSGQAKRAA
jgi:hypothetical protein